MAKRKRNPKNTAWYRSWDNAWYLTEPGKKVARLKDLDGKPIKGESSKLDADKAVARILISGRPADQDEPWTVARACMLYLAELPRKLQRGSIQERHMDQTVGYVKNFMAFCGANQCDNITFADIDAWKAANPSWEKPRHPL
ncbi:MAG: hypothetical protein GY903_10215 [Fuerstiella sp.]|nr:hypothetical protein [Fuerstiella sp.]MCP4854852.1 hypothetical protein [Fuerstiella sp.]